MSLNFLKNEPLSAYTTFRIGGKARKLFIPETKEELAEIINSIDIDTDKPIILGWGSNVLVSSEGYEGVVIVTKNLNRLSLESDNIIVSESGVPSPKLSKFCLENSLTGLEFLIGIPGTVGGAIYMNSSAHNQSISDTLIDVEIFNLNTKRFKTYTKEEIGLHYRRSTINQEIEYIISAKFKLDKEDPEKIKARMGVNLEFRKNKQPGGFNAGSAFKNPKDDKGLASGYLLDQSGVKGWKEGGAEVSTVHANFINNVNNATSLDVSRLLLRMHNAVKEKTGYIIRPEIKFIGKATEEEEKIWKILQAE